MKTSELLMLAGLGIGGLYFLSKNKTEDGGTPGSNISLGGLVPDISLPAINLGGLGSGLGISDIVSLISTITKGTSTLGSVVGGIGSWVPDVSEVTKQFSDWFEEFKKNTTDAFNIEVPTPKGEPGPDSAKDVKEYAQPEYAEIPWDYPTGIGKAIAERKAISLSFWDKFTSRNVADYGINQTVMAQMEAAQTDWAHRIQEGLEPPPEVSLPGSGWQQGLKSGQWQYYIPGF